MKVKRFCLMEPQIRQGERLHLMEPPLSKKKLSGSAYWSPRIKTQRVSLLGTMGFLLDSQDSQAVVLHVFVKYLAILKTLRLTAPTQEHQV